MSSAASDRFVESVFHSETAKKFSFEKNKVIISKKWNMF